MKRLQQYGPLSPHVDPAAEEARKELLGALAVAFPRSEGGNEPEFEGDARQEVLAALQKSFPQGSSSTPKITEITETETHDTDVTHAQSGDGELVQATAASKVNINSADSTSAVPSTAVAEAEDTDNSGASKNKSPSPEALQKGLDQLTYLSSQPTEARVAWVVKKADQLRQDGNKLFGEGDWGAASAKYRSVLDLLGERSTFPDQVQKTHDDLTVLCASNLAACALKAGDAEEALQLSEKVLAIDPAHVKARFRRALAQVRRPQNSRDESTLTSSDDACSLRWAAPRSQPPSTSAGDGGLRDGAKAAAARAAELLDAQRELEAMCKTSPRDKMVRKAVEELFRRAHDEHVHLKPPPWLLPKGMRDFEYRHSPALGEEAAPACNSGALLSGIPAAGSISGPGIERNLLIFLHGFGGRKDSFAALAETLQLPKTAVIIFNAPHELSGELLDDPPGFSWFTMLDEETMDFIEPHLEEKRRLVSLDRTVHLLADVIRTLVTTCAWKAAEIFLFGYGQGGSVALDVLLNPGLSPSLGCLGGVVGVATEVLPERLEQRQHTPTSLPASGDAPGVLLIHGARDTLTKAAAAEASAKCLSSVIGEENVKLRVFPDRGGEMLRGGDAAETRCLMEFLSDRLHGVGRRGSEEAMATLGAEPVVFAECSGEATAKLQELD
mmetsp:Transcript_71310/g.127113  ORF Transcript_71310/g.127113 Transcript_71310/m.127113 type:complete len:670 (-) Transcript_71310:63-2072(-)